MKVLTCVVKDRNECKMMRCWVRARWSKTTEITQNTCWDWFWTTHGAWKCKRKTDPAEKELNVQKCNPTKRSEYYREKTQIANETLLGQRTFVRNNEYNLKNL